MSRPFALMLVLVVACLPGSGGAAMFARQAPGVSADSQTLAEFQQKVQVFVEIHKRAEATLPRLSLEATPEQIDRNQRELGRLIREERGAVRQGEIFGAEMQAFVRRMMGGLLANAKGALLRASIMDENPQGVILRVNDRYPDDVPLSTMPPQVLDALPKLDEELEYRFVGEDLVILDSHAHIIVDYVPAVLGAAKP